MKLKYRRDLKASRPPNQKSVKFKDVSFPIYKQSYFSCCTRPPSPQHTLPFPYPLPVLLPHPFFPIPVPYLEGRTLGKAIVLRWAQGLGLLSLWLCFCCLCRLWSSRPQSLIGGGEGDDFHEHLHLDCVGHQCFTVK